MVRKSQILLLFIAIATSLWAKGPFLYCQSPDDYRLHMILHIERTKYIALRILHDFPKEFPEVVPLKLMFAMGQHDGVKVDAEHSAGEEAKWWEMIYEYYGEDYEKMGWYEKAKFNARRDRLNRKDRANFRAALVKMGVVAEPVILQYEMLEVLGDQFDRYYERVVTPEEMGRELKYPPSEFQRPSEKFMRIARYYELLEASETPWYHEVTMGYHFVENKARFSSSTVLDFLRCRNHARMMALYPPMAI